MSDVDISKLTSADMEDFYANDGHTKHWHSLEKPEVSQQEIEFTNKHIDLSQINTVLDVGCGIGFYLRDMFKDHVNHMQIVGVDISSSALKVAKEEYFPNAEYYTWDIRQSPPMPINGPYDLVIVREVFYYLRHQWRLGLNNVIPLVGRYVISSDRLIRYNHREVWGRELGYKELGRIYMPTNTKTRQKVIIYEKT